MSFNYKTIVPWGRSFKEYTDMFQLSDIDLNKKIIGCGDGPSAFNRGMTQKGCSVVSIDPIYQLSDQQIKERIKETYDTVISQTRENRDKFIWKNIKTVEELGIIRMNAMEDFLKDYEQGKDEKRYIHAELPNLPFSDKQFDIALSSHFLFLYSDDLSREFHKDAVTEMLRTANEVRIFPLLDMEGKCSAYVNEIAVMCSNAGYSVQEIAVEYQFQIGGDKMLKIGDF